MYYQLSTYRSNKTDLNSKSREDTLILYIALISLQQFFQGVHEKFNINSKLYRFNHYSFEIFAHDTSNNYYVVLDKERNAVYDCGIDYLNIDKNIEYSGCYEKEYNSLSL